MYKEELLQKIWDLKLFSKINFRGTKGEKINVLNFGELNKNSGPDFINAAAQIDGVNLYGSVEVHIKSSDWDLHKHTKNPLYRSVILHVVLDDDKDSLKDDFFLPTIELKNYIKPSLLLKIKDLFITDNLLVCKDYVGNSIFNEALTREKEIALQARLKMKAQEIFSINRGLKGNWPATIYRFFVKSFGSNINGETFFNLSSFIPLEVIFSEYKSIINLEAVFFGMSGFLPFKIENHSYLGELKNKFIYLKKIYNLPESYLSRVNWKFLRMRPYNFPTIKIAQLCAALNKINQIIDSVKNFDLNEFKNCFNIEQSSYWNEHYDFDRRFKKKMKFKVSDIKINQLVINFFLPMAYAYGLEVGIDFSEKVYDTLKSTNAEKNSTIKIFNSILNTQSSAYDSQALYGLYKTKCIQKRCLNCEVYKKIVNYN